MGVRKDEIYKLSENVVARDVHGEFLIIPVSSGVGESDEELFSLNEFGRAIWDEFTEKRVCRI